MLSWYVLNVKPYIQLLLCVFGIYFAAKYIFQRFIKSQRGFSNAGAGAGAGYTFYPHSCSRGRYLDICSLVFLFSFALSQKWPDVDRNAVSKGR